MKSVWDLLTDKEQGEIVPSQQEELKSKEYVGSISVSTLVSILVRSECKTLDELFVELVKRQDYNN